MEEAKFSEICETPYILWPRYTKIVYRYVIIIILNSLVFVMCYDTTEGQKKRLYERCHHAKSLAKYRA